MKIDIFDMHLNLNESTVVVVVLNNQHNGLNFRKKRALSVTFVHDNMIIPGPNGPLFTLQTKTFCKVAVCGEGLTKLQGRL